MADGLAGLLAAGPLAPEEMQAQLYGTLGADPARLASSSGPVGQAIGQLTATLGARPQAMAAAQQIAGAQRDAMGDMGRYLSADDPVKAAAADTGGNAAARWAMLQMSPGQVAQMRQNLTEAAMGQLNLQGWRNLQAGGATPIGPSGAGIGAPAVKGVPGPAVKGVPGPVAAVPGGAVPGDMVSGIVGAGRYPQTPTTELPIDPANIPPARLGQYLGTLNPAQRALAIQRLRSRAVMAPTTSAAAAGPATGG